jgi:type IV pilus assembly protein PilA
MNNLEKKSNKRAFTLIELIVVIAILGVLAAILVPTMSNLIGNAREQTAVANARTIYSIASAEAAFRLASNDPVADSSDEVSYTSADTTGFGYDVAQQAGQFDGTFTITVDNNVVTKVEYTEGGVTGTYPTT